LRSKSLAQILSEQGKTLDDLKRAVSDAVNRQLAEAVAAGNLTQQQADRIRERLTAMIDRIADGRGSGRMPRLPRPNGR
jgi:hypothetical protein